MYPSVLSLSWANMSTICGVHPPDTGLIQPPGAWRSNVIGCTKDFFFFFLLTITRKGFSKKINEENISKNDL